MSLAPNTFLIGTPKSGTSSLFTWLAEHPEVCGTVPKETFYLMDRESPLINPRSNFHQHGRAGYSSFFPNTDKAYIRMDGCCQYIYQETALHFIRSLEWKTFCIVLLREPAARVRSAFQYFAQKAPLLNGFTDCLSVVEALHEGRDTGRISESPRYDYLLSNLLRHSEYVTYLRRWRDGLQGSSARMLIYSFDELRRNPAELIGRICRDLGIDETWPIGRLFEQENVTRLPKNRRIDNWMRGLARRAPGTLVPKLLLECNAKINSFRPESTSRDKEAYQILASHFEPFNVELAAEFDVDVSQWPKRQEDVTI